MGLRTGSPIPFEPSSARKGRARAKLNGVADQAGAQGDDLVRVDLTITAFVDGEPVVTWRDPDGEVDGASVNPASAMLDDLAPLVEAFFSRTTTDRLELGDRVSRTVAERARSLVPERYLGQQLCEQLLPRNGVRERFDELADRHVVLQLKVAGDRQGAKALTALPWELSVADGRYILGRGKVDLVRLPSSTQRPAESASAGVPATDGTLRILVFEGSRRHPEQPDDDDRLPISEAAGVLRRALGERDLPAEVDTFAGALESLRGHVSDHEPYDLVVFEGHGSRKGLWVEDPDEEVGAVWIPGPTIAWAFKERPPRAVVLVACNAGQSAKSPIQLPGVAQALAEAGIAALAFQTSIYTIDESTTVLEALARSLHSAGTIREATAEVRAAFAGLGRAGDEGRFARAVLWQPSAEDVWIRVPPRPDAGWDVTHRSAPAERPWGEDAWLPRPGDDRDAVLSPDGGAWARRTRRGVEITTVDGTSAWTLKDMSADAVPIAISPIDGDQVFVLTTGERTTDWFVRLGVGMQVERRVVKDRAHHAAWVSDRFTWTDLEGSVHFPGDLPATNGSHIASAVLGGTRMTAWTDSQRMLRVQRRRHGKAEVRGVPIPAQVADVDELAVTPTADGPDRVWIRSGDTWHGCAWDSLGLEDS